MSQPLFEEAPRVRLLSAPTPPAARNWDRPLPESGRWKVTGHAGAGVSSFLIDTVAKALINGADADSVLVVTHSKESASRFRQRLHQELRRYNHDFAAQETMVRSVHSLAFALLRTHSDASARLITGAEQDGVIRELLRGHAEDNRGTWPENIRPALTYLGFARQLRDFLLRAVERGLCADDLKAYGDENDRPLWSAAGDFLREYQQVMQLAGTHSYSASELTTEALKGELHTRWNTVVIDDAQHFDPQSARLIRSIFPDEGTGLVVVGGDTEQSVFHFRGATNEFINSFEADPGCWVDLGESQRDPSIDVAVATSVNSESALVADFARRMHLENDVPYSEIAVIVRSTAQLSAARRALISAGVPVHTNPTDEVLSEQKLVSALMLGIKALTEPLRAYELESLVLGPIGGSDPVTLRRLIRALRRYEPSVRGMDTLGSLLAPGAILPDFDDALGAREHEILNRLLKVLSAGREATAQGAGVEETLWALWNATGLADRLTAQALRGGAAGSQADRDLDSMMSLFDLAGDFVERHPGSASISSFYEHVMAQELPTGVRDRRTQLSEAVRLLTAHGSVGTQFKAVAVTGVHEGTWPSLGETGSLFEQEDFLDLVDRGIDPETPVSHAMERLREERRLFHVATSRATDYLLVTSADDLEAAEPVEPSRFIDDWATAHRVTPRKVQVEATDDAPELTTVRLLSPSSLIAELRRTVTDPESPEDTRKQAARQLARLAAAGVPSAHPDSWWSTTAPSTEQPLAKRTALSPSRVERLLDCPLNHVVGQLVEDTNFNMAKGTIAHAYFEAIGRGVDEEYARLATLEAYRTVLDTPEWRVTSDVEEFQQTLSRIYQWHAGAGEAYEIVGTEVELDVVIAPELKIRGRIDRLERSHDGEFYRVVDLKTSKTPITKKDAKAHAQLMAYQLALSRGTLDGATVVSAPTGEDGMHVGAALLVYPASSLVKDYTRVQDHKEAEELSEFTELVTDAVRYSAGPNLLASTGDACEFCSLKNICPAQPEGKTVNNA